MRKLFAYQGVLVRKDKSFHFILFDIAFEFEGQFVDF